MSIDYSSWLSSFLSRRDLAEPDHRPLYEYQASVDEYDSLRGLLCSSVQPSSFDRAFSACFTLFCSEWYRRDYLQHYGWTWEPLWNVLTWNLSATELSRIVPSGLERYWSRPVSHYESDRRNFLGSLFSEGGLPFQLLKGTDNKFKSVFAGILKEYDSAVAFGYTTIDLVKKWVEKAGLPAVFTEPTSISLIAGMVEQLVSLVQFYELSNESEPVEKLNQSFPSWRSGFPIPLDDDTGTNLLNSLLKTASNESTKRPRGDTLACIHYWSEASPEIIETEISLPKELVFTLEKIPAVSRFDLQINEGDGSTFNIGGGIGEVNDHRVKIRLRNKKFGIRRRYVSRELRITAIAAGQEVATLPIAGSAISTGDVPISFERKNDRWTFSGQASHNVKGTEVLIVPPASSSVSINADHSDGPKISGFKSYLLSQPSEVIIEAEDIFRIKTGSAGGQQELVAFEGDTVMWPSSPQIVYIGMPKIRALASELSSGLLMSNKEGLLSTLLPAERYGSQFISIKNKNNETLLRRKIGILPADFKLETRAGAQPNQGELIISTRHNCLLQVENEGVKVTSKTVEGGRRLLVDTVGMPPQKLKLTITPSLLNQSVALEVPFPARGCLAFDKSGQYLSAGICIEELLGARMYLYGAVDRPIKYKLSLGLKGRIFQHAVYEWRYTAGEQPVEISLFNLRHDVINLFSLDAAIDQIVELKVEGGGEYYSYQISKYSTSLQFDTIRELVSLTSRFSSFDEFPEPELMLLHEPERKSSPLIARRSEGVDIGEFELPSCVNKNGPWLVVPKKGSRFTFRPLFINGSAPETAKDLALHDIKSLQKATLAYNPENGESVFESVLKAMADNPEHSGWQFLRALYDNYGHLPLPTFEVWKALLKHPPVLAMALFKFEMAPGFTSRLEQEFPILWEFFPFEQMDSAGAKFSRFLLSKGRPPEAVERIISGMLNRLGEVFPTFQGNLVNWLAHKQLGQEFDLSRTYMREWIIKPWYQDLLQSQNERTWPEYCGMRLKEWCTGQPSCIFDFEPELDYRNAVFYLPYFAACVAANKADVNDIFSESPESVFFLRQIRDFDPQWFSAIYQYCLLEMVRVEDE
ncbi:STY4851/ECs_5259 family protein [Methylophaga sp.]|uniref:STY4851/ECs_5259 family protein n=1 Tax=Methylophaga sp. TaxID=2024840 RepID=UPI003A92FA69